MITTMFFPILLLVVSLAIIAYLRKKVQTALPLPPGPRKYPLIGNLLDVPNKHQWLVYDRIAREYNSDIIHFGGLGKSIIVVNSFVAARDLLDRRSSLSSSRPIGTMLCEIMGWKSMFSFQPYGQQWRDRRRAFWQEFNPEHGRTNHRPVQLHYARDLVRHLYESPLDFEKHARHMIAAAILTITYGLDIQEKEDPYIALADRALRHLDVAFIGTYIVDVLPFLRTLPQWMPGAGFQTTGESSRRDLRLMVELPYAKARKLHQEGRGESSLVHRALSRRHITDGGKEEHDIMETAATAYLGASETSPFSMVVFFGAMAQNSDVQAKAQQELDHHLGCRLPEFDDQPYLPYTVAIMLEILRWQPTAPLGVPHSLVSDDEYKGYYLPNESIVFYNVWAILHDEVMFPDPDTFDPSRFLKDGEIDTQLRDRVMSTFGFGRRICPGRYFALDGLWLSMASILLVFTIGKATDESGCPIDIKLEYSADLNRHILPFKCSIKPRSQRAEELIHACCQL